MGNSGWQIANGKWQMNEVANEMASGGPGRARLTVSEVQRLERLLGGDPELELRVLLTIKERYGAATLLEIPRHVAVQIEARPQAFLRMVKTRKS